MATRKEISDLANALIRARGRGPVDRGRAVFLIGAGCSVSADIPAAPEVARICTRRLAAVYSGGEVKTEDENAALEWLVKTGKFNLPSSFEKRPDGSHWGQLYHYIFENHFMAPREQQEVVNDLIDSAGGHINWAHLCLGELVAKRFVHTILTTNFDQLVLRGIVSAGEWPVIADGLEALNRIVGTPRKAQVVHFHGSVHTYNLRNSLSSLAETDEDRRAVAMVHGLLHESNLLVVVGYRGGEEGIMKLLRKAAENLPELVIFWITYEREEEALSDRARELLTGQNKFIVWGGSADKFFGELMSDLQLGQPEWVP